MRRRVRDLGRQMSVVAGQERTRLLGITHARNGHLRIDFVTSTGASTSVHLPNSPSDVRGWRNDATQVRRALKRTETNSRSADSGAGKK